MLIRSSYSNVTRRRESIQFSQSRPVQISTSKIHQEHPVPESFNKHNYLSTKWFLRKSTRHAQIIFQSNIMEIHANAIICALICTIFGAVQSTASPSGKLVLPCRSNVCICIIHFMNVYEFILQKRTSPNSVNIFIRIHIDMICLYMWMNSPISGSMTRTLSTSRYGQNPNAFIFVPLSSVGSLIDELYRVGLYLFLYLSYAYTHPYSPSLSFSLLSTLPLCTLYLRMSFECVPIQNG